MILCQFGKKCATMDFFRCARPHCCVRPIAEHSANFGEAHADDSKLHDQEEPEAWHGPKDGDNALAGTIISDIGGDGAAVFQQDEDAEEAKADSDDHVHRVLKGLRQEADEAGEHVADEEVVDDVEDDGPLEAVFHGDVAEEQAAAEGEKALADVAVENAEEGGGDDDGEKLAVFGEVFHNDATEDDLFNDGAEEGGVEEHGQAWLHVAEAVSGGAEGVAQLAGNPFDGWIGEDEQELETEKQYDATCENAKGHVPGGACLEVAGESAAAVGKDEEHADGEGDEGMQAELLHDEGLDFFQGNVAVSAHFCGGGNDHCGKGHKGENQRIDEDEAMGAAEISAHVVFFFSCHDGESPSGYWLIC